MELDFSAPLWRWRGDAAWHFVTLPEELSDDLDEATLKVQRGFGSVRVEVTVGSSTWRTSVFPSTSHGAFILPVKRAVREAERLTEGAPVAVRLRPLDLPGGPPQSDSGRAAPSRRLGGQASTRPSPASLRKNGPAGPRGDRAH